jgi:di/tricarboxylate transporter
VGLVSAFTNNTPVVVLFIPIILSISCEFDFSPSKFLIPVSYASILGGTCTLIGTSTNIIVSDLSDMFGYGQLNMFELSALGVPIALLGIIFLFFASPLIMPSHAAPTCEMEDRPDRRYLAELIIPDTSPLTGESPGQLFEKDYPTLEIIEVARDDRVLYPDRDRITLSPQDLILVKGSPNDLMAILRDERVALPHMPENIDFSADAMESLLVEIIIPPQSNLLRERLLDTALHKDQDIHIIGVKRRNTLYTEQKIRNLRLRTGDIILMLCSEAKLEQIRGAVDFIIVEDVHHEIIYREKAPLTVLIFCVLIVAAGTGVADIMICALTAVFVMIITGCLRLRDAYRTLQANVLILIVGAIALGTAMDKTGAAGLYTDGFLRLFQGYGPAVVLSGVLLITSISTQILSNNATGALLVPIAISAAISLGVSPKPFIVAVCFGASACFATPIGYQTNLLVYGPGGYRFSDFLKLGLPLNLLVLVMGSLFIPILWPF